MANNSLFSTIAATLGLAKADTVNEAGGLAYALTPKQALAQYAATGCFNNTFYASAEDQLQKVIELASQVEPEFVARVALYARAKGHMKDMPALLVAVLSVLGPGLMAEVFDRVIDTPKMLRNFVQIMRSGVVGRKSLGTLPKRLVLQWLESRTDEQIFRGSVGTSPSLADVIKMVHPKPATPSRAALLGYLIGKPYDMQALPKLVRDYEAFKANPAYMTADDLPDVPMDMLTSLRLENRHWKALARKASWQTLRMNLNTFLRHGVFEDQLAVVQAARKLRDPAEIGAARAFPYQLMAAYMNASDELPYELKDALQDALEVSIGNVPEIAGKVWILPDVSGSMQSPVTGHRQGSTTKVRCIDVAALVAAAILRKNPSATILPFSDDVVPVTMNPRDSVMTNAQKLASLPSGGTNCAAPLAFLNERKLAGDVVIYVSDNESWIGSGRGCVCGKCIVSPASATNTLKEWARFKARNKDAKLVRLDIQPYATTQAPDRSDIMNIGGFADSVFTVIKDFTNNALGPDHWVSVIEKETI